MKKKEILKRTPITSNDRRCQRRSLPAVRAAILALTLILTLTLAACGKTADISAYADSPIVISGLTDEEFTVTPQELAQLKCVNRTATGSSAKAGTVGATGPLLETFLEQYDSEISDFSKIRFLCADGYKAVLKERDLVGYEIVLSISAGTEPLPESQQPLRLLIPEAESSKWAYGVTRIEFERKDT